jgi:hypothetical protein
MQIQKSNQKEKNSNIRPVGVIRANKANKAHIHRVIIDECGGHNIPYVINASAVLLYNPNLTLESLLASIDVLKRDVKLRIQGGQTHECARATKGGEHIW